MKRRMSAICVVLLMLAAIVVAQAPQMPQPGPEIKRLQYYVGTWNSEYELKPGPMGPGGKMTAVDQRSLRWRPAATGRQLWKEKLPKRNDSFAC